MARPMASASAAPDGGEPPLPPAPAGDLWHRVATSPESDDVAPGAVGVGRWLCAGASRRARVTCHSFANDGERIEIEASAADASRLGGTLARLGDRLYQVHGEPGRLVVHEIEIEARRVRRSIELPLDGAGRVNPRAVQAHDGKLVIVYREGSPAMSGGAAALVDVERGQIAARASLPSVAGPGTRTSSGMVFAARGKDGPEVVSLDPTSLAQRWSATGDKGAYVEGLAVHADSAVLQDTEGRLSLLARDDGRVLASKRFAARGAKTGSVAPLSNGEDLFVVADRVYRLSSGLNVAAKTELGDYLFGNLLVVGDALVAASRRFVFVLDKRTLALRHRHENREEWEFSGELVPFGDGFVAVNQLRYNYDTLTRFEHFRAVATGAVDLTGLPPDARVQLDGKPLPDPKRVAHGEHTVDVLRPGHRPTSLRLRVRAGQTSPIGALEFRPLVPRGPPRGLPPGTNLHALLTRSPRRVPYPTGFAAYQQLGSGFWQAALSERGLELLDARSGRIHALRPRSDLLRELDPSLPSRFADKSRRPPKIEIGLLSPEDDLVVLATEGALRTHLAAFEPSSGKRRWSAELSIPLPVMSSKRGGYFTATFWSGHGLLWHRNDRVLFGRDLATGRLVLEHRVTGDLRSELLFDDDSVIHVQGGQVASLSPFDGRIQWSLPVPQPAELYWGPNRSEIVVVSEQAVRRIDPNGKLLATSGGLPGNVDDNPAVIDDDTVFVCGHFRNRVYALKRQTLAQAWTYHERSGASPCPVASDDRLLYLADGDLRLLVDKRSGKLAHTLSPSPLPERLSPAFVLGRELCFASHAEAWCVTP